MDYEKLEDAYKERRIMNIFSHHNILNELYFFENNNYICVITEMMQMDVR